MTNNLFKKFLEFGIGSILTLIIGVITSPIITRIISPEENGKYSMFSTIFNLLLVIVILGLDQSYVRFYYDEEEDNRGKLIIQCSKIPIIFSIIIGVILIIMYRPISRYIVQEESLSMVIQLAVYLLISVICRFAMLQIRMRQNGKMYSFFTVLSKIINLVFILIIYNSYKNSYETLVLSMLFTNFFIMVLVIFIDRKEWLKRNNKKLKTSNTEMLRYGLPLVFSMAITWIFQSIDKVVIKEFAGYEQVGLYSGAMNIISLLNTVQSMFTIFWTPVAFEKYSLNENNKEFFVKVNKIITITMLFVAIALILMKDILILILGSEYRDAVFIFPYLVFMPIMYTISETTVIGINFKKKSKYHIYIAIISAIFNLVGNIILVPKFGATGAAISTGLSYIIFFIGRTYYSKKLYDVNYNLGKFAISTIILYILATYSSFHKFNILILCISIINISVIVILYKDIFLELIKFIKFKVFLIIKK